MKIGILGWYHQNNAGDDRILHCVQTKLKALGAGTIEVFVAWDELSSRIDEVNECSFLLVGGGGLILRNTNRLVPVFEKINIPFGLIGVSVDSVGPDNSDFMAYLSKHSKFILVRDAFSRDAFASNNENGLFLAPDLTFLYPYASERPEHPAGTVALSLRPWRPNLFKQYTKNYHRYNRWTHKFPVINKFLGLWDPQKFMDRLKREVPETLVAFPLHIQKKNGDNVLLDQFHLGSTDRFDIDILKTSDYLIGMRLHAIIFATQLGVPFIALNYASKVRNFIEGLELTEYVLEIDNYKDIHAKIEMLKRNQEAVSAQLSKKTEAYSKEVHQVFDTIFKTYIA